MLWLKIVICIAIVAFCTFLGYVAAGKYRARKRFFTQYFLFNERYLNELGYTRRPLSAFLKEYAYTGEFGKTVTSFMESRQLKLSFSWLNGDERAECGNYFSMLGKGDALSQKGYFTSRQGLLAEKKAACEREAKTRGDLYLKLGLLAGLAFVILII